MKGFLLLTWSLSIYQLIESSSFPCGPSFTPCPGTKAHAAKTNSILDDLRPNSEAIPLRSLEFDPDDEQERSVSKPLKANAVRLAIEESIDEVQRLFNKTEPLLSTKDENRIGEAMLKFSPPSQIAKDLFYSALISQFTSQNLFNQGASRDQIESTNLKGTKLEKICPSIITEECTLGKYRTYSGECNNVERPSWGSIYQPMQRLIEPDYIDGLSIPRGSTRDDGLPSAIEVSNLFSPPHDVHGSCSVWVSVWSLFILDDISLPVFPFLSRGPHKSVIGDPPTPLPCCSHREDPHPECFPIQGPDDRCIPYARSMSSSRLNCSLGSREQMNQVTSFIDGSNIYGSHRDVVDTLRSHKNGKLSMISPLSSPMGLPLNVNSANSPCPSSVQHCFRTGHPRSNQFPSTATLSILWMRQHNNLARKLQEINKHWDDEKIFEETRKIVIAQIQHITYSEMLPMLIGKEALRGDGLALRHRGFDSNYDMEVNPNVLNEFVSVIGGFFYSLHPPTIQYLDENDSVLREDPLHKVFMDSSQLVNRGRFEGIIRFLSRREMNRPGLNMAEDLRDRFLNVPDLDLAAWIIQMGRDHGIPRYVQWRHSCGLNVPKDWREFAQLVKDQAKVDEFASIYRSVEDVDLFVGGMAEIPAKGALMGPTFSCILGRQFHNTRAGDRFWYENFFIASAFTEDQLEEIRKTTLARIVCENTDSSLRLQPHLFVVPDLWGNCEVACNSTVIPKMDLQAWTDEEPQPRLPITQKTLEKAIRLGFEQFERLQREERSRIDASKFLLERESALVSHSLLMSPKKESIDISRKASVLSHATRILVNGGDLSFDERLPSDLSIPILQKLLPSIDVSSIIGDITPFLGQENRKREECLPEPLPCDHTSKFRTYSGWCNNLKSPKYGNAFGPMRRLLDPAYDDGFDHPRTLSKSGHSLPSARKISNVVHSDSPKFHVKFTHMLMQFGQILDHDMMHSPTARGPNNTILNCSACDSFEKLSAHCFPIRIEPDDPFFSPTHSDGKPRCLPFARSLLAQLTLGYRNQLNQLTSFLDASTIYGSTECEANRLRLFSRGLLNFTNLGFNKEALPQGPQERNCRSILVDKKAHCFEAGDERVNEQPGLTVLHTIFLREHNRIATELRKLNNFWNDEQLYQETRRIVIAKLQHIIYAEWLPVVLGCDTMARYDLMPQKSGYYTEYDPHCDASITQEMSTSAFRFGHTLIRAVLPRMNADFGNETDPVELKDHFANPLPLYNKSVGHMESLLMGLIGAESMVFNRHVTDAVRNYLFAKPGVPFTGTDLPAVNIQRGRDHGVQPYNAYREMCGFPKARHFSDLKDTMDGETIRALESVYESVDDIDLFPGLMSERPLKGALVGPMITCIIAEQMQRLKKCDRFFYENDQPNTKFTIGQLAEIRKSSMAAMICRNSNWAAQIQPNIFLMADDLTNSPITCSEVPETDLTEWIDRQWCVIGDRVIGRGKTAKATPCVTCTCTADGPECHPIQIDNCETLLASHSIGDIRADTSCAIQCAKMLRTHREL